MTEFLDNFKIDALNLHKDFLKFSRNSVVLFLRNKFTKTFNHSMYKHHRKC